jgi:hypothetical protein
VSFAVGQLSSGDAISDLIIEELDRWSGDPLSAAWEIKGCCTCYVPDDSPERSLSGLIDGPSAGRSK